MTQRVFKNARIATMSQTGPTDGYGLIDAGYVAIEVDKVVFVGVDLPETYSDWPQEDLQGRLVTPALIDCHTHLVFGGNRAREFEMRLNGAGYEEIARAGGGIVSTVTATREASEEALVTDALRRLDALINEGTATVEVNVCNLGG